jgi:hypothetical protein
MYSDLWAVGTRVDLALAELREIEATGPRFRIVHRFRRAGVHCQAGEEVTAIYLLHKESEILLRLPLALRLIVEYLARWRHLPQSASQIAAGMRSWEFGRKHGMNVGIPSRRKISRSGVKEYVKRIRRALSFALEDASLGISAVRVLQSVTTVGNEIQYKLCAQIEWQHINDLLN